MRASSPEDKIYQMKNISTIFLSIAFLLQACTSKDRHPDVPTLEKLIENGTVVFIEKKDSVSLAPSIIFLNDSVYFTHSPQHIYSNKNTKEKAVDDAVIENNFALKNIRSGKKYVSGTVDGTFHVFVNKKNDLTMNDVTLLAPDYTTKGKADTTGKKPITDIKTDEKLKELPRFDESVITKWTNTGRLGTMHELFYYQLDGKKFKSESVCYLIIGQYIYNARLGILKIK